MLTFLTLLVVNPTSRRDLAVTVQAHPYPNKVLITLAYSDVRVSVNRTFTVEIWQNAIQLAVDLTNDTDKGRLESLQRLMDRYL